MNRIFAVILLCFTYTVFAEQNQMQQHLYERPPVFPECNAVTDLQLQDCFNQEIQNFVYKQFVLPEELLANKYQGDLIVLFEVTPEGHIRVLYTDAMYPSLKEEAKRVFQSLPIIQPATYNGNPTYKQYSITLQIPLQPYISTVNTNTSEVVAVNSIKQEEVFNEIDSISKSVKLKTQRQFSSTLNIPFNHSYYSRFDSAINAVGLNMHTGSKPLMYNDVRKYYDFEAENEALIKDKSSWFGRKLWNEHLVELESKNYWFLIDALFDLEVGKDTEGDFNATYNNTRGVVFQGGLGKHFSFSTSFYESQGRFAQYFNDYAEAIEPSGSDPAIIPGRGIAKRFKTDAFDYPVAEGYLSYAPTEFFNLQFGHGKNFIGDGYRSLLISDVASPSPFLKINVSFWKLKYTSAWLSLRDVRPEVTVDKTYLTKYMAYHYLSLNVSKRLNIGLFESVLWYNTNDRGFDLNYLNPVIFLRGIEFQTGQGAGNVVLGFSSKYKLNNRMNLYGQFIIDEFSLSHVTGGEKSWKNKFGLQLGYKYYNAFGVDNLMLQLEYNQVRPYTYSHNTTILNYGHNNQSMAHLWGANFRECMLIGRYKYQRWFADTKLILGTRGFDFNTDADDYSYGGDIYRNYNERPFDTQVKIGQGIKTTSVNAELQAGYLINPASNLKLFGSISYRNFNPEVTTTAVNKSDMVWFNIGLRSDLFNWYFDL